MREEPTLVPTTGTPASASHSVKKAHPLRNYWERLSTSTRRILVIAVTSVLLLSGGAAFYANSNQPVSLYSSALSSGDMSEIARRLTETNAPFTIEGNRIMVTREDRSRLVGVLLSHGLPRAPTIPNEVPTSVIPISRDERARQELDRLQREIVIQLRQMNTIADASVTVVPQNPDALPGEQSPPTASVLLSLKPGPLPSAEHIAAIVNLVAHSVRGLEPGRIKVTDTSGRVWNDGLRMLTSDPEDGNDARLDLQRAYENRCRNKIQQALNLLVGSDAYAITVNVDMDFHRITVVEERVGAPGGNNVETISETGDEKTYQESAKSERDRYRHFKFTKKFASGKVQRTAVLEPGSIRRVSATVVVDGARSASDLETLRDLTGGAIGYDEGRGDTLKVRTFAFTRPVVPIPMPLAPQPTEVAPSLPMLGAPLVAGVVLALVFVLRRRGAAKQQTAMATAPAQASPTRPIVDLTSDGLGRATTVDATRATPLETLARERPSRLAEALRSTWLAEKDR